MNQDTKKLLRQADIINDNCYIGDSTERLGKYIALIKNLADEVRDTTNHDIMRAQLKAAEEEIEVLKREVRRIRGKESANSSM